jgi:hypothetical protein
MSEYIKALKDSGIIQYLRKTLDPKDLDAFDKLVEEKVKEYNQMWLETQPMINEYNEKVKSYAAESKRESGPTNQRD